MKLWILKDRSEELPEDDDPWSLNYDVTNSFVIRAKTEELARQLAQDNSGDESIACKPWLDAKYTTCQEIVVNGDEEVICRDGKNG